MPDGGREIKEPSWRFTFYVAFVSLTFMDSQEHSSTQLPARSRAWYEASITDFLVADEQAVLGSLTANSDFTVLTTQRDAWVYQIKQLEQALGGLQGTILLEFSIPRMGRRIDAVLLIGAPW